MIKLRRENGSYQIDPSIWYRNLRGHMRLQNQKFVKMHKKAIKILAKSTTQKRRFTRQWTHIFT